MAVLSSAVGHITSDHHDELNWRLAPAPWPHTTSDAGGASSPCHTVAPYYKKILILFFPYTSDGPSST